MAEQNWAYVAGFFDGEGNIRLPLGARNCVYIPSLAFFQAGDGGKYLLEEIRSFIGRGATVYPRSMKGKLGKKPQYELRVYGKNPVLSTLARMLPYLRLKKAVAQDILRYWKLYPSTRAYAGRLAWETRRSRDVGTV